MKEKIIARLRALYPGVNLSKARLDAIADKLKITEETEIDEKLTDLNEIFPFSEMAKQDDRVRTLEAKEKKKEDPKDPADPKDPETPKDDQIPEWAKQMLEANKTLVDKINAIETGKAKDTRKSLLEADLKDVPLKIKEAVMKDFARIQFETDQDFEDYRTEKKADLAAFVQDVSNDGLGKFGAPIKGDAGGSGGKKQASKEEVDKVYESIKP